MGSRSSARGGDHGHRHHLDHHHQLLLRPAAAAWGYDGGGGGSWRPVPPTQRSSSSYTCGYCKREFRSAQGLGGHMNAHRRERAMLRHCSFLAAAIHRDRVPNLNFSPPHCTGDYGNSSSTPAVCGFFSMAAAAEATAAEAALVVDLELGLGRGLDLELRLGCS